MNEEIYRFRGFIISKIAFNTGLNVANHTKASTIQLLLMSFKTVEKCSCPVKPDGLSVLLQLEPEVQYLFCV